jgi:Flp pilus assembly protein TadD
MGTGSERNPATAHGARHYRRGLEDFRAGRFHEAVRHMRRALDENPANNDWRYDLAVALQKAGRHEEAIAEYRRVLDVGGEAADALANLALSLRALGRLHEAEPVAERAVALAPASAEALHNLGIVRDALGHPGAIAVLERAVALSRDVPEVLNDLGVALDRAGELERAEASFRKALAVRPRDRALRENLSGVLYATGRVGEAEAIARALVADEPGSAEAHLRLALCLRSNGETAAALDLARRCVALAPTGPYWNLVGQILRERDDPEGAIAAIREALRLQPDLPDAWLNLAHVLLASGRFREGWAAYAQRPKKTGLPEGAGSELLADDAGTLAGRRVLLVGEQGPGDELFFLRFAPVLRVRGATLAYTGDPRLARLLTQTGEFAILASRAEAAPAADCAVRVGELPLVLRDHEALERPPTLRLAAGAERRDRVRAALAAAGPPPYVAATWQAGPAATRREAFANRTLFKRVDPQALGAALRAVPGTVVIVQRGADADDVAAFDRGLGRSAPDLTVRDDDLEALLALMELLDDYVGVSNTNMHLRAAAGRVGRVLMPLPPDWRWGATGDESPWFPGFRVYREAPEARWDRALARLGTDLAEALLERANPDASHA